MPATPFLRARWENLAIVSYAVHDAVLRPFLPRGLALDRREGRPFVSLVAFDFRETCVFGRRWPRCVNFPEVNLRFYVQDPATGRRGVCFIRELVEPRPVAWIARVFYNEPYARARMRSRIESRDDGIHLWHSWRVRGREHTLGLLAETGTILPAPGSAEHWLKEHEWGFGRDRRGRAIAYRVDHPPWPVHPVRSCTLDVDFGALYGREWAGLTGRDPDSVILAAGSEVAVYPCRRSEAAANPCVPVTLHAP